MLKFGRQKPLSPRRKKYLRSSASRKERTSFGVTARSGRLARAPRCVRCPPPAPLATSATVDPLVHAPEAVQSTRIRGVGVVDDAVLERERAHARPLARVRGHVGSGHGRQLASLDGLLRTRDVPRIAPVVVFDDPARAVAPR